MQAYCSLQEAGILLLPRFLPTGRPAALPLLASSLGLAVLRFRWVVSPTAPFEEVFPSHERLQTDAPAAQDRFSHEGQPGSERAQDPGLLVRYRRLRPDDRRQQRQGAFRPARRPPLRQRPHPPGHGPEQGAQGHGGQVQEPLGLQGRVRAGLGLPRAAHRAQGGAGAQGQEEGTAPFGGAQDLPRIRHQVSGHPAQGVQAAGRAGGLGRALQDHEPGLRGRHGPGAGPLHGQGLRDAQQEAHLLVSLLPDRPGRGRGGVPRPRFALHLRALPPAGSGAGQDLSPGRGCRRGHRDLDHHALDHSRQHGRGRASGIHLRAGAARGAAVHPGQGAAGNLRPGFRVGRVRRAGRNPGRGPGGAQGAASVLRTRVAAGAGRLRDPGDRHGLRAHRPRPWPRGL